MNASVYVDVSNERHHQEKLKSDGRFKYTCADPEADHGQCFAVLLEEVGEAAQALRNGRYAVPTEYKDLIRSAAALGEIARSVLNRRKLSNDPPKHRPDRNLKKELIQSAAVIVAWLEGFEEKS